jgi:hypothetical protein
MGAPKMNQGGEGLPALRRLVLALFALAALSVPGALAGERIHFKNGHVLDVLASRTEGRMVYLTLPDRSEIGVPAALIADIEGAREVHAGKGGAGPRTNYSGRGPAYTDLWGFKALSKEAQEQIVGEVTLGGLSKFHNDPDKPYTFGFSYRGSQDISSVNTNTAPKTRITDPPSENAPKYEDPYGRTGGTEGLNKGQPSFAPEAKPPDPKNGPP